MGLSTCNFWMLSSFLVSFEQLRIHKVGSHQSVQFTHVAIDDFLYIFLKEIIYHGALLDSKGSAWEDYECIEHCRWVGWWWWCSLSYSRKHCKVLQSTTVMCLVVPLYLNLVDSPKDTSMVSSWWWSHYQLSIIKSGPVGNGS